MKFVQVAHFVYFYKMGLFFDTSVCNGKFHSADDADVSKRIDLRESLVQRRWLNGQINRSEIVAFFAKNCAAIEIVDDAESDLFLNESCTTTYDGLETSEKYVLIATGCKFVVGNEEEFKKCGFSFGSATLVSPSPFTLKFAISNVASEMQMVMEKKQVNLNTLLCVASWKKKLQANASKDIQNVVCEMQLVIEQGYANVNILQYVDDWKQKLLKFIE